MNVPHFLLNVHTKPQKFAVMYMGVGGIEFGVHFIEKASISLPCSSMFLLLSISNIILHTTSEN